MKYVNEIIWTYFLDQRCLVSETDEIGFVFALVFLTHENIWHALILNSSSTHRVRNIRCTRTQTFLAYVR